MEKLKGIIQKWNSISLVKRIICGLIIGIILGLVVPQASAISILGGFICRSSARSCTDSGIFPDHEFSVPYGRRTENQLKGNRHSLYGGQCGGCSLCRGGKPAVSDRSYLF